MAWVISKYFLTAIVVVVVSEIAKRSDKFGGLIAALPLRVYEFLCNRLMSDTVAPDRRHHEPIKTPHHRRAA